MRATVSDRTTPNWFTTRGRAMAIQQRMRVRFEDVFPEGVGMRGTVTAVEDFDMIQAAKAEGREPGDVQVRDKESGLRVWEVRVVDYDEEAPKNQGEVTVKIAADVQPVPRRRWRVRS